MMPHSDLHAYICDSRQRRIRCYWCKHDEETESGPWSVAWQWVQDADRMVGLCYDHSDLPRQALIAGLGGDV